MQDQSTPQTETETRALGRGTRLRLAAVGFAAGLLNGLLSIGGGILIMPGLIFLRGFSPRRAVSTSLVTVLLMSTVAFVGHVAVSGFAVSMGGTASLILAGMASAQVGGWLLNRLHARWIFFLFAGMTLVSATQLLAVTLDLVPPLSVGEPPLWSFLLIGAISGFFSGVLGVGGGGMVVLGFSIGFHMPILGGLPVALAVNVTNSFSGVLAQVRKGNISWRDVFRIFPSTLPGVGAGVLLAVWLSADALRIAFALFFYFIGTRMFLKGIRSAK